MTYLIDWRRVAHWMPGALIIGALLGLLVVTAGVVRRQQDTLAAVRSERDRMGGELNATQELLSDVRAQLLHVQGRPSPVCPPAPVSVREDIGHETPIFSRW